jgi:hypothetical protein
VNDFALKLEKPQIVKGKGKHKGIPIHFKSIARERIKASGKTLGYIGKELKGPDVLDFEGKKTGKFYNIEKLKSTIKGKKSIAVFE